MARRSLIAGLIFSGVLLVYAAWRYPTVAPRDSADLAASALTLSCAHPPGYPLYALLGKAWLKLMPWGDAAYRLNLMSSAAGAAAAAGVFMFLAPACGLWAGLGGALAAAFSLPLWKFSLLCEMYSLQALFLVLLLGLAPDPEGRKTAKSRAAASALLLGLALVNHQAFILAVPGLLILWWGRLAPEQALFFPLGLGLYAFLWVHGNDPSGPWAVLTRRDYGTWQLSAGLGRALDADSSLALLGHLGRELWRGTSPLTVLLALIGFRELWLRRGRQAAALGLLLLAFGPGFFLMSRIDVSGWVARTVLETALVVPALLLGVAAGFGLGAVARRSRWTAAGLAAAVALFSAWRNGPEAFHRDDFSAYDYLKDLRRALPPGEAAWAAGDTALYGSRYLDLARPQGAGRRLIPSAQRPTGEAPRWVSGLALERAAELAPIAGLRPAGLVQTWDKAADEKAFWEVSVLRPSRALLNGESYARDVLLTYAFAHYVSGRLQERQGLGSVHYLKAAALDPEDYQIEYNTAAHAMP